MPKKKKDEAPMAPLPAIDHAYVQALKIQTLVCCLPPLHMCVYITALMIAGGACTCRDDEHDECCVCVCVCVCALAHCGRS